MIKFNFSKRIQKSKLLLLLFWLNSFLLSAQTITGGYEQGTHGGYFYSWWFDQQSGSASMTLGPEGNYSTQWSNAHNFTAGKGWKPGSRDKVVCFEGTYDGGSNGFLALYGWTRNPLIEYYVCEKHGQWEPPGNTSGVEQKGTYTCDGGTYKAYTGWRSNAPSIDGTASFSQYWSVRQEQRSSGTIDFASHVDAWKSFGMDMGTSWDYMIMESEGYMSSGSSNITVWECPGGSSNSGLTVKMTGPSATEALIAPANVELTAEASSKSGSVSKVEFYNGNSKIGEDASAPYSYTWSNVEVGSYEITAIAFDNAGESVESTPLKVKVNVPQGPYKGTPHAIPGKIEFEEYDEGGNGSAYYDLSAGTSVDPAPNFRTDEDVDIETCEDTGGGYNLGWTEVGEWTEYTVNVEAAGTYTMELRIASDGAGKNLTVESDGKEIAGNISIPSTGGWQTWETVTETVELQAGEQVLRFTIGGDDYINMNFVEFTKESTGPTDLCPDDPDKTEPGECGCGVPEGTCSQVDLCPDDPDKTEPGECGCGVPEGTCSQVDLCPDDPNKTEPGDCGCGIPEGTCSQTNDDLIQLYKGWNLIGYPLENSANIETALSSIWDNVITVKDIDNFYSKNNAEHLNLLKELDWGMGYFIEVSQDCKLEW